MSSHLIAGVDEAGRGPLAGPVFAAAVILDPTRPIEGLNDSKKLTEKKREKLFDEICEKALCYAIAEASVHEIDQINILQASLLAMQRSVLALSIQPVHVQVDGNQSPKLSVPVETIIQGDSLVPAISAASILAKVARDRYMLQLHQEFPQYQFAEHKGYSTPLHMKLLQEHGACIHHRKSFAPVAKTLLSQINK